MKGFLVFLVVALVASASAVPQEKGILEDALATIKCVRTTVDNLEASINNIVGVVGTLNQLIASNTEKLNACLAIGGGGGIINQLESAQCVIALSESFKGEIIATVNSITNSVNQLVTVGDQLSACF